MMIIWLLVAPYVHAFLLVSREGTTKKLNLSPLDSRFVCMQFHKPVTGDKWRQERVDSPCYIIHSTRIVSAVSRETYFQNKVFSCQLDIVRGAFDV